MFVKKMKAFFFLSRIDKKITRLYKIKGTFMETKVDHKKERLIGIHSVIGVAIMLLFRFLPVQLPEITQVGMNVIGIFIGTLYLWTFVGTVWSSLLAIGLIGISAYKPMGGLLAECFGNPTMVQIFFLMIVVGALVQYGVIAYIVRFFLTRKISNGRPWMLAFMVCIGAFCMAAFINAFAVLFLFWPVLYGVFEETGYSKTDDFPRIVLTLVAGATLLGFPTAPFAQNGLALITNFAVITQDMAGGPVLINNGGYLVFAVIMGLGMTGALIGFCKYVLKPDDSKLKKFNVESMNKKPLPPMTLQQKTISWSSLVLVLAMMLPSFLPDLAVMKFFKENLNGLALIMLAILSALRLKGKPVVDIPSILKENFSWPSYFLVMAALLLGGVLTSEATGVSAFLETMLSPLFEGMSPMVFTVALLVAGLVLTNLCNSLVVGMLLQPVIVAYCAQTGAAAAPIAAVMIIFVLESALLTPAASPVASVLHGNREWIPSKYVYRYTIPFVLIELIMMCVIGIPLANLMM